MKVIIAAAGTAGHINPGLAIANKIKKEEKDSEIMFIGTTRGLENDLVPRAGYELKTIDAYGLSKKISIENMRKMIKTLQGYGEAKKIIKEFKPDIVIGTGGYICGATISAAHSLKIPTMLHESNAFPGKAIKMLARKTDTILVSFKDAIPRIKNAKNVVIIGAGYIGVELVEAFEMQGKNVTLIDAEERIMAKYLDKEFTDIAEKEFVDRGVNLVLGEKVSKFEGENGKVTKVVTNNGSYEGDLVVLCIGFAPNTKLVQGKLDTLPNGAIIIDEYMRTSKEDVFAAGDCCVVKYNPAHDTRYIPLATNAVRMGTLVARNIVEPTLKYMGTQGTSGIKIYEKCIASTGLTEEVAKATTKMNVASVELTDNYRPEFMPTYLPATIKLVFDKDTRRIIGGQIISDIDLTQFMNTLSVVIQNEMTIEELAMTDFFFQPHFNKPWSLLNAVALKAL